MIKESVVIKLSFKKIYYYSFRENRLTHILIFVFIGLSVLMTPILSLIPMPVLFGVFLYMGIAALKGIQFFDRILIMFMPLKYQPDYAFLRQVRAPVLIVNPVFKLVN